MRIIANVPNEKVGNVLEALERLGINEITYHIVEVVKTRSNPHKRKPGKKKRATRTLGDTRKSSSKAVKAVAKYMAKHGTVQTSAVAGVVEKLGLSPSYAGTILHTMCKEKRCRKDGPGLYVWLEAPTDTNHKAAGA